MVWRRPILGVVVAMVSGCGFAQIACSAPTPQQALPSASVAVDREAASSSSGSFYRLARIVVDPELHRRWALIANCTHPERPLEIIALSTGEGIVPTLPEQLVPPAPRIPGVAQPSVQAEVLHYSAIPSPPIVAAPTAAMFAKSSTPGPSTRLPAIRAGDLVRLWRLDGNVRLEMAVVSLEYGRVGQIVHLRRLGQTALLAGVVVGEDSAELIP